MNEKLRRLYRGDTQIDFIGRRRVWFAISAVLITGCIALLLFKQLDYGIEFTGGVSIQAPIEDPALADADVPEIESILRDRLAPLGAESAQIQVVSDDEGRSVLVQTEEIADAAAQQEVVATVADTMGTSIEQTDSQRIGSKWGGEITTKALRALVIFIVVVSLFITWRFEWKMALTTLVAMIHDLVVTAGVYSLSGFEVTPSTVIAILTILGYSLYDNVVVFDKVEEDTTLLAASGKTTYEHAANRAINEVFMRSFNTTLSTLIPVATLLLVGSGLLGAKTLQDLGLALFVGLLVGAYSSIFVATPLLTVLKEREPKYRSSREKLQQRAQGRPAAVAAGAQTDTVVSPPVEPVTRPASTKPARARSGSKKAKRRKRR